MANAHKGQISCAAWSPDGKLLVTGGYDRSLKVWDAATGKMLIEWKDVHKGHLRSVAFSPDGKRLVTTANDNRVTVWDFETREPVKEFDPASRSTPMSAAVLAGRQAAGGRRAATRSYKVKTGSVLVYDTATWEEQKGAEWAEHQANVGGVQPRRQDAGGRRLRQRRAVALRRELPASAVVSSRGRTRSAASPARADGKLLAAAHGIGGKHGNGSVVVFDAATGQEETVLLGHTALVLGLSFGPDGRVGTASNDGTLQGLGAGPADGRRPAGEAMTSREERITDENHLRGPGPAARRPAGQGRP